MAVTFFMPLCSQVKGFGPVVSDSLLSQVALPALSSAERQWILERLHPCAGPWPVLPMVKSL